MILYEVCGDERVPSTGRGLKGFDKATLLLTGDDPGPSISVPDLFMLLILLL